MHRLVAVAHKQKQETTISIPRLIVCLGHGTCRGGQNSGTYMSRTASRKCGNWVYAVMLSAEFWAENKNNARKHTSTRSQRGPWNSPCNSRMLPEMYTCFQCLPRLRSISWRLVVFFPNFPNIFFPPNIPLSWALLDGYGNIHHPSAYRRTLSCRAQCTKAGSILCPLHSVC